MLKLTTLLTTLLGAVCVAGAANPPSEITVRLKMDHEVYVIGERLRAVVDVANTSPDVIDCRTNSSPDKLVLEAYRASDKHQFDKASDTPYVAGFALLSGEGQKLEAFLGDHFPLDRPTRYFARAVLVHAGQRYESPLRTFDVVPGMKCGGAMQMFTETDQLKREFELVHWHRGGMLHLFLKAKNLGGDNRQWTTADLGPLLRVTRPKISVLPTGEVITLHRATQDTFIRSEFWSLPEVFEFHEHETMLDPEVVGAERVKEMYKDAGGVEAVKKAWWKFW